MTVREIRKRARALGIEPGRMGKTELVRTIQSAEGNPLCYRSGREVCDQTGCMWLPDCIPAQVARAQEPEAIGARTGKWRR